jgi:hypothetical protein
MKRFSLVLVALTIASLADGASIVDGNPQKAYILNGFRWLITEHGIHGTNHFFVFRKDTKNCWVYWREGMELWNTTFDPYYESPGKTELTVRAVWDMRFKARFKPIDLAKGVVSNGTDTGSSTYLVKKNYVADIVYDCVTRGELLEIPEIEGKGQGRPTYWGKDEPIIATGP